MKLTIQQSWFFRMRYIFRFKQLLLRDGTKKAVLRKLSRFQADRRRRIADLLFQKPENCSLQSQPHSITKQL